MLWVPADKEEVVNVAVFPDVTAVPITVSPSKNFTVSPSGSSPVDVEIKAVKASGCPYGAGLAADDNVVTVWTVVIACKATGDVLGR